MEGGEKRECRGCGKGNRDLVFQVLMAGEYFGRLISAVGVASVDTCRIGKMSFVSVWLTLTKDIYPIESSSCAGKLDRETIACCSSWMVVI